MSQETFQALRGALQPITAHDKAMLPHLIAAHQNGTLEAKYLPRYREILANHVAGKGGFAKEAVAATPEEFSTIRQTMESRIPRPIDYAEGSGTSAISGGYVKGRGGIHRADRLEVGHGEHLGTLAHELGHAMPRGNAFTRVMGTASDSQIAKHMRRAVGIGRMLTNDPILTAAHVAMQIPTLTEEARASINGLNAIHETHGLARAVKEVPNLLRAFGTYAMPLAAPTLLHYAGKAAIKGTHSAYAAYMAKRAFDPAAIAHAAVSAYHHPMVQTAMNVLGNIGETASNVDHPRLRMEYGVAKMQQYASKIPSLGARRPAPKNPFGPAFRFANP